MSIEYKSITLDSLEVKAEGDARTIEGMGSVFGNVDGGGDIVLPGAFAKSLQARKPAMLWQHKSDHVIGVWDDVRETPEGLFVKGRILETQLGNDAYTLAKAGALTGMSIGYATKDSSLDKKTGNRHLKELSLYEVSLVTFPMNEQATITRVKALDGEAGELMGRAIDTLGQEHIVGLLKAALAEVHEKTKPATERELEECLRDVGFSQSESKKIVSGGYKAIAGQREVEGHELDGLFHILNNAKC